MADRLHRSGHTEHIAQPRLSPGSGLTESVWSDRIGAAVWPLRPGPWPEGSPCVRIFARACIIFATLPQQICVHLSQLPKMPEHPSPVTADDIAEQLGISRSTVSRALTPGASVSERTRQLVLRKAKAMGYRRNELASALTSPRKRIVGIVMAELENPIHATLIERFTRQLQQAGSAPIAIGLGQESDFDAVLETLMQYQVGVVVLASLQVTPAILKACEQAAVPTLALGRLVDTPSVSSITADQFQGGLLAARHAIDSGYRRIAVITGPRSRWTSWAREVGFLRGLDAEGLSPVQRIVGDYTVESGSAVATELFSQAKPKHPDLVYCANDLMAIGLIDTARDRFGLRVPQDLGVIGFDNIPMAAWTPYSITTIELPIDAMVAAAVAKVCRIQEGDDRSTEKTLIPVSLVVRHSTDRTRVVDKGHRRP